MNTAEAKVRGALCPHSVLLVFGVLLVACALCALVCFVLLYMYSVFIEFHYIKDSKALSVNIIRTVHGTHHNQ